MTDDAAKKKRELEHELTLTMTAQVSYMKLIVLVMTASNGFLRYLKFSEDFRRSPKISDDFRRLLKISQQLPKITELCR